MWAQFNDRNGDINDAGNYIQGTAGSMPTWGDSYRHPDVWQAEGWKNDLVDDWIPPQLEQTADEIRQQKINDLNDEYQPQFSNLQAAYTDAQIRGDTAAVDEIQTDYTSLQAEYNTKMEAITNE